MAAVVADLERRAAEDQAARGELRTAPSGTPAHDELVARLAIVDARNLEALRDALAERSVQQLVRAGGGQPLFVLTQHADADPELQARVLDGLRPLIAADAFPRSHFALLSDRIAVARGERQEFGSQGSCVDGRWKPFAIDDEADLDARRAAFELPAHAEYRRQMDGYCEPEDPRK